MRLTPKLALTTAAVLLAVGLLWVGFMENGRERATAGQGFGASVASQYRLIAGGPMAASAIPRISQTGASPADLRPNDNVTALALSGTVVAAMVMLALGFARFHTGQPTGDPVTATPRRTRLATSGPPQL